MADEWKVYVNDPRIVCKYGTKCYQRNEEHLSKFKHPPNDKRKIYHKRNKIRCNPYARDAIITRSPPPPTVTVKEPSPQPVQPANLPHDAGSSPGPTVTQQHSTPEIKLPDTISYYNKDNVDNTLFKDLFLVEMPKDFFELFDCLRSEANYEKILSSANLQLIGPFDLLSGKLPILEDRELYLINWRFFYDPPEFQAVFKVLGKSEYHVGYFRDEPSEKPVFLGSNNSAKDCIITPIANNIFAAIYFHLENEKGKSPFISLACQKLMDKVKKWAEELQYPIQKFDAKKRISKCVTKTFHGAGIMVPFNKKTEVGYRRLVETDANLKKLFLKLSKASSQEEQDKLRSEIQPVITYANIAVDECDFGTGLEMGIDLFCTGLKEMEPSALSCLSSVYTLLERHEFTKIIQAHLKYRRRGSSMSIVSKS